MNLADALTVNCVGNIFIDAPARSGLWEVEMTVYLEYSENADKWQPPFDCEKVASRVVEAVLDHEGCPYEAEVSVMLTDDAQIRKINLEQRQIDRATDVLSFPMVDYPQPGEFDFLEDEQDCFHPETGELLL